MESNVMRELAIRLSTPRIPMMEPPYLPKLFIQEVPDSLPVHIPFPDEAAIIGTLIRNESDYRIVVDIPMPQSKVIAFYKKKLPESGWRQIVTALAGRFATETDLLSIFFRKDQAFADMQIVVSPENPIMSEVTIYLNIREVEGDINPDAPASEYDRWPIPLLPAPLGGEQISLSNSAGRFSASATALVKTDIKLQELQMHYGQQVSRHGWIPKQSVTDDWFAVSTWGVRGYDGRDWMGVLTLMETELQSQWLVSVSASALSNTAIASVSITSFPAG